MLARARTRATDRPHWAARIEDAKNRVAVGVLEAARWRVRIQPYTGYGSTSRVRILAKLLYASPSSPADFHDQPIHDMRTMAVRGFRSFTSQCAPFEAVQVRIGDRRLELESDRAGIIDSVVEVELSPGRHEAVLTTREGASVTADVHVFDDRASVGLVSDIDDTVMVTWLPRPLLAFWNAFVVQQSSRRPVPGMAMLYQEVRRDHPDSPILYLSTGAWNVFPVLRRFLFKNGYPEGPMLLTDWGPTNTGLFRSGMDHKLRSLDSLARLLPEMRWILVGDDGQHDPEIYERFGAEHPGATAIVAIRQLTEAQQVLAHGSRRSPGPRRPRAAAAPAGSERRTDQGHLWVEAPDGFGLAQRLRSAGLLRRRGGAA